MNNMSKKSGITIKSDLDGVVDKAEKIANDYYNDQLYEVECPHCGEIINIPTGLSKCSICDNEVNLDVKFNL